MPNENKTQLNKLRKIISSYKTPFSVECISTETSTFRITFKHGYLESFPKRVMNWLDYGIYKIKTALNLKTHDVMRPIHLKHSAMPIDEIELSHKLNLNGFKIVEEYLGNDSTAYDVVKV